MDIVVECSIDGGQSYSPAIVGSGGDGISVLTTSVSGTPHVFSWNTWAQGLKGYYNQVLIRITPSDFEVGTMAISGYFTVNNPLPLLV